MNGFFEEDQKLTPCQCNFEGGQDTIFCDRHKCTKTKHLHSLCQHSPQYFDLWEKGEGPMQNSLVQDFEESGPIKVSRELLERRNKMHNQKESEKIPPKKKQDFLRWTMKNILWEMKIFPSSLKDWEIQ